LHVRLVGHHLRRLVVHQAVEAEAVDVAAAAAVGAAAAVEEDVK